MENMTRRLVANCATVVGDSEESGTLAREVAERLASDEWLSTQSVAFALVAYAAYMEKYPTATSMDFTYTCEGKSEPVSTSQSLWAGNLLEQAAATSSVALANKGKSTLFARWIAEGTPAEGQEQAYANGLSLAVSYVDMNGKPVQVDALPQGTNFAAVVTVRNVSPRAYQQLALTELFPAGWEILNTRYLHGGQTDSTALGVSYQDIRDDRVYTYIGRPGLYLHRQASGGAATDGAHQSLRRLSRSFLFASCLLRGDV